MVSKTAIRLQRVNKTYCQGDTISGKAILLGWLTKPMPLWLFTKSNIKKIGNF